MPGRGFVKGQNAVKGGRRKKPTARSLKAYGYAAAAADKKVAAAERAFNADPSAENKAAVQQARAKACAARAKLGRAVSAEEGGSESGGGGAGQPWSQQKRANQARTDGSIKKVNPSPCDVEARAEVVQAREPWENAMEIMRERKCGCVHSRIV